MHNDLQQVSYKCYMITTAVKTSVNTGQQEKMTLGSVHGQNKLTLRSI